ncbi:hypothetical protein D3C79_714160 [compost metagenome]
MLHLPLHAAGLGHVGAEFKAAQRQVRSGLNTVDFFTAYACRRWHLPIQRIQPVAQGDDQVFGHRRCACQLAGNERVKIMHKLASHARLGIDVIERVERQCQVMHSLIMVPRPTIAAVLKPHPAKLGRQCRPGG